MRDKRSVDELTIEELERVLAIKKREARQQQMNRMQRSGRVIAPAVVPAPGPAKPAAPAPQANGATAVVRAAEAPSPTRRPAGVRFEDDPDDLEYGLAGYAPTPDRNTGRRIAQRVVDRALLLVEVAAVIGFIYVAVNLFGAIGVLQRETQEAQQIANDQRIAALPTIAPTPTIRLEEIVLPGGHTFTENGQPVANLAEIEKAEIPEHLRARAQAEILRPVLERPIKTPETAIEVDIPAINVAQSIVQGTDWEALRQGVGQALNGVRPGDRQGNLVLAAHNDIYGEIFRDLDQLAPGDEIYVRTETEVFTYIVRETIIVEPTEVWVMRTVPGEAFVTLISCYPYGVNDKRIVVFADRQAS